MSFGRGVATLTDLACTRRKLDLFDLRLDEALVRLDDLVHLLELRADEITNRGLAPDHCPEFKKDVSR